MPTVKLNRKVFEKLVGRKLPEQELKHKISMLGTDLESVDKDEINVEVFPNRPDMLSEQGFARAFSAFIGEKPGIRKYEIKKSNAQVIIDKSVSEVRPYTACAIVRNLKIDDEKIREIIQLQEKLHVTYGRNRKKAAIGIYPLEKIKLPIHYKALPPNQIKFRPLEASREMTAEEILNEHPTGKEYGHLLKGKKAYPVFLDSSGSILSMPPIINSALTGRVTEETTDVFIECSGHDFEVLSTLLNMIVTALADMGGSIESMELKYPDKNIVTPDLTPKKMPIDISYAEKKLGLKLSGEEVKRLLERMGYFVDSSFNVHIPAYRADILHPIDLVEDIAIAYGFDNFSPEIPSIASTAKQDREYGLNHKAASVLTGLGFQETSSYHLTGSEQQTERILMPDEEVIMLSSSVNEEYNSLRKRLFPVLLDVLSRNRHHEYPHRIFEIGSVFSKSSKTETGVNEETNLAVLNASLETSFTEAKQQLDALMRAFDAEYKLEPANYPSFIPGRCAEIEINGKKAGIIGEIHPAVLQNFDLPVPVAGFEIRLSPLYLNL
ncbi:phenylalanine--tRNA ligase subunit beta [Candidatus Woesearchaeota archaeon]|nr:MAG: phenylalanine--tRNA ligase subunit beta [Candidatus Woesearchaeota archaeon]